MSGTAPQPPAGVVWFDYQGWAIRFPELAGTVAAPLAASYFAEACLYLDNSAQSVVADAAAGGQREALLWLLTAHIAALNGPGASPLVGRISSATEGSVSVSTDYALPGTAAWYGQTRYGAAFYAATARFRTMRYIAPGYGLSPFPPHAAFGPFGA